MIRQAAYAKVATNFVATLREIFLMSDTSLRLLTLLKLIPRRDPGLSVAELQQALDDRGFDIGRRSIERDLVRLSSLFPITNDEGRPLRWFWARDAAGVSLPGHDPFSALTWQLIEDHLKKLLPRALRQEAEPRFREAREYLAADHGRRFRRWRDRVRILPRSLTLKPPELNRDVMDAVYDGLLLKRQVRIRYRRRGSERGRSFHVHPLALVLRDGVCYLVVTVDDFSDLRQIVAHRIASATLTDRPANEPAGFDLDAYIHRGGFDYSDGECIELVLHMDAYVAQHLAETPLSDDQQLRELGDDRVEIRASVLDSMQLRWWLMAYGSNLEVIAPRGVRLAMREEFRRLAALYA